jgi:hypothetical protein
MGDTIKLGTGRGVKITLNGSTPQDIVAGVEQLGRLPNSAISGPARKVATKVRSLSANYAPKRTGALKKNITVGKKERTATKGKYVYDVMMRGGDVANAIFQRPTKSGKYYYYPASQEYGFKLVNGSKVAGRYYLKSAAVELEPYSEQIFLDEASKALDKAWAKKQGELG